MRETVEIQDHFIFLEFFYLIRTTSALIFRIYENKRVTHLCHNKKSCYRGFFTDILNIL